MSPPPPPDRRRRLALAFVGWKVLGLLALATVVPRLRWEGATGLAASTDPLRAFYNWDAFHYVRIATDGYAARETHAFYPLFPMLLRAVMVPFGDAAAAGIALTTLLTALFAVVYWRFARDLLSTRTATVALVACLALPSAFFLHCLYTESLFLLLLFLFLGAFLRASWLAAAIAPALVLTRGQGLFVGLAVGLVFLGELPRLWRERDAARAAYLVGVGLAFVAAFAGFLAWERSAFGDPFEFVKVQALYWPAFENSILNSLDPRHVLVVLFTPPRDLNGPAFGVIDKLAIFASLGLAPAVWRLDRRLFAFYFCLAWFPATMGTGGSYFRFFLLPWSIAALAVADRHCAAGATSARRRLAVAAAALGLILQWGFSLLHAGHRWVG
ncbi:MAG: hypothetical protein IT293_02045 [Deltaproteobacteria bacterium]|nr:hypothetical protein [Deltaproteobacteria bacterium]